MKELRFDGRPNDTLVGYFTYTVEDDHWSWSEGMFELHGYEPYAVPATTELTLQHKHPDDAVRAFEALENVIGDGRPFSCYHRIIDAKSNVKHVLSVGRGMLGPNGKVEQVNGFFVDLTDVRDGEASHGEDQGEAVLLQVAETRSTVDQAKGIVMVALGCDDVAAFAALRRCAAERGMKLSELSRHLVEEASAHPLPEDNACRAAVRELLDRVSD